MTKSRAKFWALKCLKKQMAKGKTFLEAAEWTVRVWAEVSIEELAQLLLEDQEQTREVS